MARRLRIGWVFASAGAIALAGACSLNPQPIPPGETDRGDAGTMTGPGGSNTGADGGGGDGFTGTDGGTDSGPVAPPPDGGDFDASDGGEQDAATDAGDL